MDKDGRPNQYLLTGSANPARPQTHSGAARIVTVRMRPLSLFERGISTPTVSLKALLSGSEPALTGTTDVTLADYTREILASGFPGFRQLTGRALRTQLDGYLARIVDRDFEEQGHRLRSPHTLQRWLKAYAGVISTPATLETVRDASTGDERQKPARSTAIMYREVLERLWIVDPVPAWVPSNNALAPLILSPKHHLADPALAARLFQLDADALLQGAPAVGVGAGPDGEEEEGATTETGGVRSPRALRGPNAKAVRDGTWLGRLFEALVTLDVRVYAQSAEAQVRHLRTYNGRHEVDLIVVRPDQRVLGIEVKLGPVVNNKDVQHLKWLKAELGDNMVDAIVVNTGPHAYRRDSDGIGVVPAALLGP